MKTPRSLPRAPRLATQPAIVAAILAAALLFLLLPPVAMAPAQEDMKVLAPEALAPQSRPAARFVHDTHNEKAKIDECGTCHHGTTEDGRRDATAATSEGTPCADCHAVHGGGGGGVGKVGKGTPLERAYHRQCMGCHREQGKGPTACGGCHTRV
ncbi:acidic tetraheme cytochrome c3 TmcA [Nitratidesulfovibrio sp. SRB-5]|uniref:acidic tetraheme cytochrome c3 TmcA n=1 Tax=Nitratidesulfovibrio sp. SRB-5 TaxID=2872636 RepID=UPI0010273FD7|nr:cytochrome c3 family protein [Nitratidesulfovibrio sp. SRB-5]MBZ2170730.1 cytochrome c family protein [Nitratidesulfovibrio sp. SRB-5]RXF77689.1 cytochrome C [Desulfovibrio sp. DS-1]